MRQDGEPSVEQILRSIKKVMARDAERTFTGRDEPPPEPADEEEAEELRELSAPPAMPQLDAAPEAQPPDEDGDGVIEDEGESEAEAVEGEVARIAGDATPASGDSLVSGEAAASMQRSLAALAMLARPDAAGGANLPGAAALDGMVREMLRPMLAQWLEAHMPAIVEREIKAEIARITGGGAG